MTISRESGDETEVHCHCVQCRLLSRDTVLMFLKITPLFFVQQCFQNWEEIPLSLDRILGVDDIRDVVNGVGMV